MGESHQEERRFLVASVTPLPAPRTLGGFPEYEIPPAYGLWLPLRIAPDGPAPPRDIPDEDGMTRFSFLAPPNHGIER
jgi:hypothetical protein